MPFGLKNARSTYQQMMTKMFEPQLGKNVEVYIDDMVVKSKLVSEHVTDLTSIFEIPREHKLRLNASKCAFGVGSGKFMGYMVTHRGIEVNPDQIKAINNFTTALKSQRGTEAYWNDGRFELVHIQIGRQVQAFLPSATQVERICVVRGVCCGIPST